ncbi:hypothetical protein D3C80_1445850 [compost metagenome]
MRIGTDQGIRVSDTLPALVRVPYGLAEILQVDLVADTGARRHNAEAVKGFLPPTQEGVTLVVALHFNAHVFFKSVVIAELINGDRVVNHQIDR